MIRELTFPWGERRLAEENHGEEFRIPSRTQCVWETDLSVYFLLSLYTTCTIDHTNKVTRHLQWAC